VDGAHDLGGKPGFGRIVVEADEPVFHAAWEGRVRALQQIVAKATAAEIDERRHAIERMDADQYLASTYYERWLTGAATLAVEHGVISVEQLEERSGGWFPLSFPAEYSSELTARATQPDRPRFGSGTRVTVVDRRPLGHCRCPAYVRSHTGLVTACNGPYPLPDLAAHRLPARLDYCDNVSFSAADLFGGGDPAVKIHVDLFECYLEPAK
jgi:nitrile hydratase beta subunit